jgi:competence protein ComEC
MVEPPGTLQSFSNAVRNHFLDVLSAGPRDQATAFLKALVISDESDVLTETWDTLRSTGTVHIVSVSGYHVFIISAGMLWVASLFPIPRGLQLAGVAMLLLAYLGITGLTGPIVRSALMVAVLGCATLIRREPDPLSALGLSGLIFLIFEPGAAFRPGFQLSFVAVGALSVFLDGSGDRTITAWCGDLVRGTLVASAATAPLVAYHFGSLPVFGILGNAAIALPAPFVLSAGFLLCISPSPIAEGMLVSLRPLLGWILESARLISQIPFAQVSVPEFSGYWLPVVYVGGLMMWRSVRREP